jgi:imidazolonepropionase-like amidohydrolase
MIVYDDTATITTGRQEKWSYIDNQAEGKTTMTTIRIVNIIIATIVLFVSSIALADTVDKYLSGDTFLIHNVTIIDGLGNAQALHQDIFIKGGKITAIMPTGKTKPTGSPTVIEGKGLTAMPGLIDMHIHLQGGWAGGIIPGKRYKNKYDDKSIQKTLAAFLYSGVTTVLDVGNDHKFVLTTRNRINQGEFIAPRFFTTGAPFSQAPTGYDGMDGDTTSNFNVSVKVTGENQSKLGDILDSYQKDGIEIIKLYSGISALAATFLNIEAKKRGITTIADLWKLNMNQGWMQMTGLDGWAHATPFIVDKNALKWMKDNDRFIIATANVGEKLAGARVKDDGDNQSFLNNPLVIDIWGKGVVREFYDTYPVVRENFYEGPDSFYQKFDFGDLTEFRTNFLTNIKNAHEAGVLVAGGSDAPSFPSVWSGESMHRELELIVMAGIKPVDAIKMCSHNAAKILKRETQFGSLQAGMSADIILVAGKPWENISDSRNLEFVFVRGKLLDRQKLLTSWQ